MKQRYKIIDCLRRLFPTPLMLLIAVMAAALPLNAERWRNHPAFDNGPIRIVDTERYTFFQVFQKLYSTSTSTYKEPVTALLVYDKVTPQGIVPMKEHFGLHGGSVRTIEYSPEGGFLAVLYMDGGLDIVSDNGAVIYNDELKRSSDPSMQRVNSMTLSDNRIWLATPGGYMVIDGKNGSTLALSNLGAEVKYIASCGDKIILFNGSSYFEAAASAYPRSFSEFKSFWPPTSPGTPRVLMPRKDGSFIYLADKRTDGNHTLNIAYPSNGKWAYREIEGIQIPVVANTSVISNPYEMNFVRNKEGWLFFTSGEIRQLKMEGDPLAEDLMTKTSTVRKDHPESSRTITIAGSWDGNTCWTYLDRGNFSQGTLSDNRYLIDDNEAIRPNLPAVSQATHLAYSPSYGSLAVNYGYCWAFPHIIKNLPPLLSACKEGVWTLPNPAYYKPRSAEENADLNTLYKTNAARFPIQNPSGMTVDPVNQDYVWMGSVFGGMAALNMRDPKSDPIHLGSPADPLAAYPGFKAVLEDVTTWKGYSPLSAPSFDSDGNLWAAYHYIDGIDNEKSMGQLLFWPRENREKVLASGDASQIDGVSFFEVPSGNEQLNAMIQCVATTHPEKKNLVFMYVTGFPRFLARLNHKGTLNYKSDDETDLIYNIEDQHGAQWIIGELNFLKEEPSTALIWVGQSQGLLCFDPAAEVKNGVIKGMVLDVEYENNGGNPLSFIKTNGLTFDDEGRMWITTTGQGVWCVSADRKRVEAHYTTSNSPLPHDTAYGIIWNPESRSVLISTQEGLAEVWPDGTGNIKVLPMSVSPREVTPDYMGPVAVRGLNPQEVVKIENISGEEITTIIADPSGVARWNLLNNKGEQVKNGFYKLSATAGTVEIVVMRN